MSNKSEQYVSSLLGAIDTVLSQRLTQLAYDKTIVCTITDNSNAKNGVYQVSDGSVKFQAQSENTDYRINDQVRVQVPNGDMTQEKFILGRYTKDIAMTPITYLSPVDSVLKLSDNLITENKNVVYTLVANGDTTQVTVWDSNTLSKDNQALQSSQIYDTIYLEAEFKSLLSNYNLKAGNYGLVLELYPETPEGFAGTPIKCVLDCSDMLGNPYAFSLYTKQAATFDISNIPRLHSMKLLFVQDNNFISVNGTKIIPAKLADDTAVANLFLQNISLGFGSYLENVPNHTVKIFTADSLTYDRDRLTSFAIDNDKTLNLIWYNKDSDGKYVGWGEHGWIDESQYIETNARLNKLKAMVDYNIPMDEAGLEIAANITELTKQVKKLSKFLSADVNNVLFASQNSLAARMPDDSASITFYLKTLQNKLIQQSMELTVNSTTQTVTLKELAERCEAWCADALHAAAAIYNYENDLIPDTLGNWEFIWKDTSKLPSINEGKILFATLETWVKETETYLYDSDGFLSQLKTILESSYLGYLGIYNEFERRCLLIQNQLSTLIADTLQLMRVTDQGTTVKIENVIEQYLDGSRTFIPWKESSIGDLDNKYCIYWYRYDITAPGDKFMPQGWRRITFGETDERNYKSESIQVLLDASYTTQEQFQALVIFNHVQYKSNILTFTNKAPIISDELANLADNIRIYHGENSQSTYQNYSAANILINGADRFINRVLNLEYICENGGIDNSKLHNAEVYWYVPKTSTMLDVELTELAKLNEVNPFREFDNGTYYREGYRCFFKTIGYATNVDPVADYSFIYRIKDYYSATASNNTIICKVVRDGAFYENEITFSFTTKGASGTEYTIAISPLTSQAALTPANDNENPWQLKIELYDSNNKPIAIPEDSEIEVALKMPSKKVQLGNLTPAGSDAYIQNIYYNEDKEGCANCNVLQVTITNLTHTNNTTRVNISTVFPIPFSDASAHFIEGPSIIIYDASGGNPTYNKQPYKLYSQDTGAELAVRWDIWYDLQDLPPDSSSVYNFLPKLNPNNTLTPSVFWIKDGDVHYTDGIGQTICPYARAGLAGDLHVWEQPIILMQNRYASPVLNAWDGSFKIDEENGTILSTMVGAGYKGTDNSFYGVLMGDIATGTQSAGKVGLYGYHAGAQSFGFDIDGTAFIGKSNGGRIYFDGNKGTISDAQKNLSIDLDDGKIEGKNFTLSGADPSSYAGFILTTDETTHGSYFKVTSTGGSSLIDVTSNGVLIQSDGDDPDIILSLRGGNNNYLKATSFTLDAGGVVRLSSTSPYLQIWHGTTAIMTANASGIIMQDAKSSVKLNLTENASLYATNFTLTAGTAPNTITLSSGGTHPLNIAGKFIIGWDGSFSVNDKAFSITADGALSANGGTVKIDANGLTVTQGNFNLGNGNFVVTGEGVVTINKGSINLGAYYDGDVIKGYYFSVTDDGILSLSHDESVIKLGQGASAGDPAIRISKNGLEMQKGSIKLGYVTADSEVPGSSPYYEFVLAEDGAMTLLNPNSVIRLGQSQSRAGDPAVKLSSAGLEMHEGSIKLGYDADAKNYNVIIDNGQIKLGLDSNANAKDSHFFNVTSTGAMTLYHPDSIIELGQSKYVAGDPAVKISSGGVVINQGKINLANNFVVSDTGNAEFTGAVAMGGKFGSEVSVLVGTNGNLYLGGTSLADGSSCVNGSWSAMFGPNGLEIKNGSIYLTPYTSEWGSNYQVEIDKSGIRCGSCLTGESGEDVGHNFSVDENGNVTMNGALNIANIITMHPVDGFKMTLKGSDNTTPVEFSVSKTGKLTATNAQFKGTLTINSYNSDHPAKLQVNGKTYITGHMGIVAAPSDKYHLVIGGDTRISGDFYITPTGKFYVENSPADYISFNDGIWMYGTKLSMFSKIIQLGDNGTVNEGEAPSRITIFGQTTVANTFTFLETIQAYDDGRYRPGVTDDYSVKVGLFKSSTLHFVKGILVDVTKGNTGDDDDDDDSNELIPAWNATTDNGKVLVVNGSALAWSNTVPKATALKVNNAIGSSTEPVYFNSSGQPVACGYDFTNYITTGSLRIKNIEDSLDDLETFKSNHTHDVLWEAIQELREKNHHEPYDDSAIRAAIADLYDAISNIKECTCTPNPTN